MRSCDKKVRKKLGQQKWKLKKKTRETKVWLQKKKRKKNSKLGHHQIENHFFSYYQKSLFYNDSEKINPFLPTKKSLIHQPDFLLLFFLSCSLPPIVFLSNFWQNLIMLLLDHYYYILLLLYANVQSVFNAYQITFWI